MKISWGLPPNFGCTMLENMRFEAVQAWWSSILMAVD